MNNFRFAGLNYRDEYPDLSLTLSALRADPEDDVISVEHYDNIFEDYDYLSYSLADTFKLIRELHAYARLVEKRSLDALKFEGEFVRCNRTTAESLLEHLEQTNPERITYIVDRDENISVLSLADTLTLIEELVAIHREITKQREADPK